MVVSNTMAQQQERNHPRVTPFSILDILGKQQRKCGHAVDEEDSSDLQRRMHSPQQNHDEHHPRLHEPSLHSRSAKISGEFHYHQKTAVDFIQYKHYDKIYVNTDSNRRPIDDLLKIHQQPSLDMMEKPKDLTYRSIVSPTSSRCDAEIPHRPSSQSSEEEVEETDRASSPLTLAIDKGKTYFPCRVVSKLKFFIVHNWFSRVSKAK